MAEENKCGHDGCGCSIEGDALYCCEYCQEANSNDPTNEPCDCGCETCKQA